MSELESVEEKLGPGALRSKTFTLTKGYRNAGGTCNLPTELLVDCLSSSGLQFGKRSAGANTEAPKHGNRVDLARCHLVTAVGADPVAARKPPNPAIVHGAR